MRFNSLMCVVIGITILNSTQVIAVENFAGGKILQCYYLSWAALKSGVATFYPENTQPFLCTHLTYAYAKLDEQDFLITPQAEHLDLEHNKGKGLYNRLTAIKYHNPQIKILLGIGGFDDSRIEVANGVSKYSKLISDYGLRYKFIHHAAKYLLHFGFDGLEIHWEFPSAGDKIKLAEFLSECKTHFQHYNLLLTLNVGTNPTVIEAYDADIINRHVDFVNLMTYDFHSYYEGVTNYISPLYSINNTVQLFKKRGFLPEKMVVGIATYAKSYKLLRSDKTDVKSPVIGPGDEGPITRTKGYLSYAEICGPDWNRFVGLNGSYAYKELQWASYNDVFSIIAKVQYVIKENLLGVSFWSLDQDDFNGFCRNGYSPLINAAKEELNIWKNVSAKPSSVERCLMDGFFVDQVNCKRFYECKQGILQSRSCGEPLFWDQTCTCCVISNEHCKA